MGLETLAIGANAGGMVMKGVSANAEGKASQALSEYNAKLEEIKAKQIEAVTGVKQQRQAEKASRTMSTLEAGLGASGAVTTQGEPLMMAAEQEVQNELENLNIGYEGQTQAAQARSQAAMDIMEGKQARGRGRAALFGSLMKAGGTVLQGYSKWSSKPKLETRPVASTQQLETGQAIGGADPSYVASPEFESLSGRYGTFM